MASSPLSDAQWLSLEPEHLVPRQDRKVEAKMCIFFVRGSCKFGSKCRYAHGLDRREQAMVSPGVSKKNEEETVSGGNEPLEATVIRSCRDTEVSSESSESKNLSEESDVASQLLGGHGEGKIKKRMRRTHLKKEEETKGPKVACC